jgi:hypothetical protein
MYFRGMVERWIGRVMRSEIFEYVALGLNFEFYGHEPSPLDKPTD